MPSASRANRVLRVTSPAMPQWGGNPALEPVAVEGHEGLSRLFAYTVTLLSLIHI